MKQWIRWSGLAGFILITALIAVLWLMIAGPAIKYAIEEYGSRTLGAKIDVEDVSLTFNPVGIEISQVQVTDPKKPMENVLQFDTAQADIRFFPLLTGNTIIDHMVVEGVRTGTPRQYSGELKKEKKETTPDGKKEKSISEEVLDTAEENLPTADEILSRESLLTESRGKALQAEAEASREALQKAADAVPNEDQLAKYEKELRSITSERLKSVEDFRERQKRFEALKKQFSNDRKAIAALQKQVSESKQKLQDGWKLLQSAPQEDYARIRTTYQLNASGATNVSRLLFGEKAGEWTEQGLYWYEKARPFLEKKKAESEADKADKAETSEKKGHSGGEFIRFPTPDPLPDFLIRSMKLSVILEQGELKAEINNITDQQWITGQPVTLTVRGKDLQDISELSLDGEFNQVKRDASAVASFNLNIRKWDVKDYSIGAMGMTMDHAVADVNGKAELTGDQVSGTVSSEFSKAAFSTRDTTQIAETINKALSGISTFNLEADIEGKITAPGVSVRSDLDDKLKRAVNKQLEERIALLEQQLRQKINQQLEQYAGGYQQQLKALNLMGGNLGDKQEQISDMLSARLSSFEEQQKKELKERLKKEQRKKEKELEKKLQDKLKNLF